MSYGFFKPLKRRTDGEGADPLLHVGIPPRSVLVRLFIYDSVERALYWRRRTPDLCMTSTSLRSFNMTYAGARVGTANGRVVIFGHSYREQDVIEKYLSRE